MPRVRLTYGKDIKREGTNTLDVSDDRARTLVSMRRAVVIEDTDVLAGMTKAELLQYAAREGIAVDDSRATKARIIAAIRATETG